MQIKKLSSLGKKKGDLLYDGKTKSIFIGPKPGTYIMHFKDEIVLPGNNVAKSIHGKGVINCRISEHIMSKLSELNISNHFVGIVNMREQLVKAVAAIPVKVIVRNVAAGRICKNFQIQEGVVLPRPIIEFYAKNEQTNFPMITEEHIEAFNWLNRFEIDEIMSAASNINYYLTGLFHSINVRLIDFKLEFGRFQHEESVESVILCDEISPDTCRLWDIKTNEVLDKDRYKIASNTEMSIYQEIANRLHLI